MIEAAAPAPVVGYDCEHDSDDVMARDMVHTLSTTYPGHDWFVIIRGVVIQIKAMNISDKWCMSLHYSQVVSDANDRRRQLIRSAGEFLERAHLRRGQREQAVVKHVEGIPDKHLARNGF